MRDRVAFNAQFVRRGIGVGIAGGQAADDRQLGWLRDTSRGRNL
jgi:hypothetical protein